ncbi:MAG TPA: trypsin-like serine protease [Kofleriaceae bacterium]|nr:trypsin-like serine protease [Kofleriaceae bacterium]
MSSSPWSRVAASVATGAICWLAWGCSVDPPEADEEGVGVTTAEVRGRARDDHSEVAQLWTKTDGEWGFCTATLIDRKIAITAAHCIDYGTNHSKGNYGYLEVKWKAEGIDTILTTRYRVNGIHSFAIPPFGAKYDVALVRLSVSVPCAVAHPARVTRKKPPAGSIVSKWGYGGCDGKKDRKRAVHLRRGQSGDFACSGDSGGPTMDPDGAVYAIHSESDPDTGKDFVAWVDDNWNGITRVMDQFGRAGRCQ